jgi:hypothetical protein
MIYNEWCKVHLPKFLLKVFFAVYTIHLVVSPHKESFGLSSGLTDYIEITLYVFYPRKGDAFFVAEIVYDTLVSYTTNWDTGEETLQGLKPKTTAVEVKITSTKGMEFENTIEDLLDGLLPEGTTQGFGPISVERIPPPPKVPRRGKKVVLFSKEYTFSSFSEMKAFKRLHKSNPHVLKTMSDTDNTFFLKVTVYYGYIREVHA